MSKLLVLVMLSIIWLEIHAALIAKQRHHVSLRKGLSEERVYHIFLGSRTNACESGRDRERRGRGMGRDAQQLWTLSQP